MSKTKQPTLLKEYAQPDYLVTSLELHFELDEDRTVVFSRARYCRNHKRQQLHEAASIPLVLNGIDLEINSCQLDGDALSEQAFSVSESAGTFTLLHPPSSPFTLEFSTTIYPEKNTALEGLYKTDGLFCTQCEAEGFRKITFFLDRPDILTSFTTRIEADKSRYPVLLSNGNRTDSGELANGRHYVVWEDPFPKPSYLFALVAGDLALLSDTHTTPSGRTVTLEIYADHNDINHCRHAIDSLKKSMVWDEEVYGREYDLDIYMIVAVRDFNMGAMENKGLNIFNDKYILADPASATDQDYAHIENVIAHEYFHNWTGNRITCRDWFQLSLKEGLTVFRDQEFSSDMQSRTVKRIQDVQILKTYQFVEDSGPTAHPVQPQSYYEINNFYTLTVYNKGAEVVRMLHTLLGADGFHAGMDLYFDRHDGQAVTIEDFLTCMQDATGRNLDQFKLWYTQAGTPTLSCTDHFDPDREVYTLTFEQSSDSSPGQPVKRPYHIPVKIAFFDEKGSSVDLAGYPDSGNHFSETLLEITSTSQSFDFSGITERPQVSLLRDFSAPVHLKGMDDDAALLFSWAHDTNGYNRWHASQRFMSRQILEHYDSNVVQSNGSIASDLLLEACKSTLDEDGLGASIKAMCIEPPSVTYLMERVHQPNPSLLYKIRAQLRVNIATGLRTRLRDHYHILTEQLRSFGEYAFTADQAALRHLKNASLSHLVQLKDPEFDKLAFNQFNTADNMTDALSALTALVHFDRPERKQVLKRFHDKWKNTPLVMDKWFAVQAMSPNPATLRKVRTLLQSTDFSFSNPNRVRALLGSFSSGNPACFHAKDGAGYRFLADQIIFLDTRNPQLAARLTTPLCHWRKFDSERAEMMCTALERILKTAHLSKDVLEIVTKSLPS
ncbi:MAG: aminopeptidase N [Magnetococcales bacterium]|nr:aminopeptidase N [Magnetococcales bacterium]